MLPNNFFSCLRQQQNKKLYLINKQYNRKKRIQKKFSANYSKK